MERLEIYTSKKKAIITLLGSVVFVTLGIWCVFEPNSHTGLKTRNPNVVIGMGILSILFFGLGIFLSIKRLIKSEIALIISTEGLNINPKKSLFEVIRWSDILGFNEIKIGRSKAIIICVKNPKYWLDKETNTIRKKLMQFSLSNYNSPFNISALGLDISSDKLIETLSSYFEKYKKDL